MRPKTGMIRTVWTPPRWRPGVTPSMLWVWPTSRRLWRLWRLRSMFKGQRKDCGDWGGGCEGRWAGCGGQGGCKSKVVENCFHCLISSLHGLTSKYLPPWWTQVQATLLRVLICCWNTATPDSTYVSTAVTHHRDQQVHYYDINTWCNTIRLQLLDFLNV